MDGYVNIAPTPVMWRRFCKAIDREDLIEHQFDPPGSDGHRKP